MTSKTLKTLVLKTVTVGSVKLATPADRIGLGASVVATYPAEVLSSGQFPLPPNPEPETLGSRQELPAMQTHPRMHTGATTVAPAGRAGCLPNPGPSARRHPAPFTAAKWASGAGRLAHHVGGNAGAVRGLPPATRGRTGTHSAPLSLRDRLGCDCQSPDRHDDRWCADDRRSRVLPGEWVTAPAAAAGK